MARPLRHCTPLSSDVAQGKDGLTNGLGGHRHDQGLAHTPAAAPSWRPRTVEEGPDDDPYWLAGRAGTASAPPLLLLTGATGYVGGRLLARLEATGRRVRCLTRRPEALRPRVGQGTEVAFADVSDPASLPGAMAGGDIAYYLVHSMGSADGFEEQDRAAARKFGAAARAAGVRRIIYLGGLGDADRATSPHLRSRREVGDLLRASGVEVIEFRASIVLGSGSLSFEMIRALVERLPVMIAPRWVAVKTQPIGITDLLAYLVAALDLPAAGSRIYEIGGADQVSFGELMQEYARQRGLRRRIIPVPVLTPRLSSLWLGLVTPLYARVGRKLIDSMTVPTVVRDESARRAFPIAPLGVHEAMAQAIANEDREQAATRWSDALSASGERRDWGGIRFGSRLVDSRTATVRVAPADAFAPIARIGGKRAGTTPPGSGACADSSMCWSAGSGCAGDAAIPRGSGWATRSTGGGSRRSSRTAACAWSRK